MGTMTRLVRGLAALIVLVLLLAGIPTLLWQLGGNPLPSTVPSLDDITSALSRQENGDLVLQILAWVGWVGWASFALSVLVEIPAQLRGLHAPRLPAMQLQQAGQLASLFADVRRGKSLAINIAKTSVKDTDGNDVDPKQFFGIDEAAAEGAESEESADKAEDKKDDKSES